MYVTGSAIRRGLALLAQLFLASVCGGALAQGFPTKSVTMYMPGAEGGTATVLARPIAQKVSEYTGQQILSDSRPGGEGAIAAMAVKNAAPDGTALLLAHPAMVALPLLMQAQFDMMVDFRPVITLAFFPSVLLVQGNSPAKTVAELIAYGKAKPGGLFYGHNGLASTSHLLPELLKLASGVPVTQVPYKGILPAITDLLGGRIDLVFAGYGSAKSFAEAGRLRVLAVVSPGRLEKNPDFITIAEAGYPSVYMETWFGLFAPARTPEPVVRALYREFSRALGEAGVRGVLEALGSRPGGHSPEEFGKLLTGERGRIEKILKVAGVKPGQP